MRRIFCFLGNAGAAVDHVDLPAHGIRGNGHGLIYERNSDESFALVTQWLREKVVRA